MNPSDGHADRVQDPFLHFSYFGLFSALKRYRTVAFLGWGIVALAVGAMLFLRHLSGSVGLAAIGVAVLAVVAGVALVQVSVAALAAYVRVPFPEPPQASGAELPGEAVRELKETIRAVEAGGWQEAFAALEGLRAIGARYDLPPLE
jgi:hypothetical protein